MQQAQPLPQQEVLRRRLPLVVAGLILVSIFLLARLISFQFQLPPEVVNYLESLGNSGYSRTLRLAAARGLIYDRHGQPLAVNMLEYEIGISPNLVAEQERRDIATQLAALLNLDELEIFQQLGSDETWVLLARPVTADVGQQIEQLDLPGVTIASVPRRRYPQGTLASQVIGFVAGDASSDSLRGYYGVEGYYQEQLAGQVRDQQISNIPFDVPLEEALGSGKDIVLTIDRDIQFLAESQLLQAISETGSTKGTILIMNPRNGDILAMASYPSFDANAYYDVQDPSLLVNSAISEQYEPGSVMKVLTVAGALEQGIITPGFTYNDQGRLEVGGITVQNWDRRAYGLVDATQILVQSLNVGAATISTQQGPTNFYNAMRSFGIGRATGIDLEGEAAGTLFLPGDPNWSESQLATNSFGQGVATTPLQMLVAFNSIANGGLMMQPHVMHQVIDGTTVITSQPSALGRPISAETARVVTDMMVAVVRDGLDGNARLPGYTIAGKTGTAEIPSPIGYEPNASIVTFIGFFPADDPQVSVLVKLDRPTDYWGSQVAAPVFRRLAERLVILLEIPTDDIRHALAAEGGSVGQIRR
jgi:cell division protein FtsI (penicillin-binding protein 3)